MSHLIAPSILTANFLELRAAIEMINGSEADWLHLDIMDGAFVPNMTFGFPVIKLIKEISTKPLDTHLMIVEPDRHLESFRDAGADMLTVHYEACTHLDRTIDTIKSLGMKVGVAINPHTSVRLLENVLPNLDLVLNMTVNPGYGAQSFIEYSYRKIRQLREMRDQSDSKALIQIDGGVGLGNLASLKEAGVDVFVVGNTVFASDDPVKTIKQLKEI
jgi:ribulose-phosphate 3-epimerase